IPCNCSPFTSKSMSRACISALMASCLPARAAAIAPAIVAPPERIEATVDVNPAAESRLLPAAAVVPAAAAEPPPIPKALPMEVMMRTANSMLTPSASPFRLGDHLPHLQARRPHLRDLHLPILAPADEAGDRQFARPRNRRGVD